MVPAQGKLDKVDVAPAPGVGLRGTAAPGEAVPGRHSWNVCSLGKKRVWPVRERIVHGGDVVKWLVEQS